MPRRKRQNDESDDSNWLTTYGDMMTLLLAFFVLLYSFSSINEQKFKMALESLQGNLGVLKGGKTVSSSELITAGVQNNNMGLPRLNRIHQKLTSYLQKKKLQDDIKVKMTERGLTIRFTGKVLFDLGEAKIKDEADSILDKISDIISRVPNQIMVEGHTDNLPISNSRFPSNWELSTARATNVVKYFIEENGIVPAKLSAAGYSKYKPVKPNNSSENRALNRRVDVILLKKEFDEFSGQKGGKLNE
ncbi:flagellar motor protein MotB [Sporohalobacter salinus]|uniref:flagellar motor protein MotB n=1 Tax=Sporohalobacter salinus TaxID=1494606 RepID=UPI001960CC19|nr:flagellar motor protein MotB [Sporohalobacter salinus]MBM7623513.1 chemotaxis protein MotB [Sporohalobacter salinus]